MRLIAPIVEGHGEVEALPTLLHRIAVHAGNQGRIKVNPPLRVKSQSFLNDDQYFGKYVTAASKIASYGDGIVLILLDSEDFCPAEQGPQLLRRAINVRPDVEYIVVLAYREFETWFITAIESLMEAGRFRPGTSTPPNPESYRDAKGWLSRHLVNFNYDPISHQRSFCGRLDIDTARNSRSFDRLYRRITSAIDDSP